MSNPVITDLAELMSTGGIPDYIFRVLANAASEINRLEEARRVAEAGERSADLEVERLQKIKESSYGDIEEMMQKIDALVNAEYSGAINRDELVDHYQIARDQLDELYSIIRAGTHGQAKTVASSIRESADILHRVTVLLNCNKTEVVKKVGALHDQQSRTGSENHSVHSYRFAKDVIARICDELDVNHIGEVFIEISKLKFRSDLTRMLQGIQEYADAGSISLEMSSDGSGIVLKGNGATLFTFDDEDELWIEYEQYIERDI